jgi:hypothetical protein
MISRATRLLAIGASFIAMCDTALAERVKWRVAGVVDAVGPRASALPFPVAVGQPFVIDMEFENDSTAVTGGFPGSDMATYNNVLKASVFVGGNEILIMPSVTGSTSVWNDQSGGLPFRDRYSMVLTDAATEWEVRWQISAPSNVPPPGPLNSLSLLQTPPNPGAFAQREMRFRQDGDSSATPSITATLDSITAIAMGSGSNPPGGLNPGTGTDANGGGGGIDAILLAILGIIAVLRSAVNHNARRRRPVRQRKSPDAGLVPRT